MRAYQLHQRQGPLKSNFTFQWIMRELEELLYRSIVVPLVAFLPAPIAYGVARLRADWCYRLKASERERIMRNLKGVLGHQLSLAERAQVARDYIRRHSCEAIDTMRLAGRGRALARLVEIRGLEYIKAARADGKGVIICSAHFGLYSGSFSLLGARGFPVTTVGDWRTTYDTAMSPLQRFLWRDIHEKRVGRHRRPNIEPAKERFGTAIRMMEILRSNELITMAVETPLPAEDKARAMQVDFLGHQMLVLTGAVSVAQLTGAQLLVLIVRRSKDWMHQVIEISPPIPLDGDTGLTVKRYMAMLESPIRQSLAHWDYWGSTQNLVDMGLLPAREQHEEIESEIS
jgi:KDO2-lipid IV(A) lauroyltransferase